MLYLLKNANLLQFIRSDILILIDKVILALLTLLITHILVIILRRSIFEKMEKKQKAEEHRLKKLIPMDHSLMPILRGIMTITVYTIGICMSLETLGIISKAGILTLFGSVGLGAGFAIKDVVSNVVSGVTLLVSRPFKPNDYIACNGTEGTIKEVSVLTTKLETIDGMSVAIPNNIICSNPITNYSSNKIRRIVISIFVSHKESLEKVIAMLHAIVNEDTRFLKKPTHQVVVSEIQNNAVQIQLRAWTATNHYWDTYYDNMKKVKDTADMENINLHLPALMQVSSN